MVEGRADADSEIAHSQNRVLHVTAENGDATSPQILLALKKEVTCLHS